MKFYVILVTGGEYFLTPCIIIKANDDETAMTLLKQHNRSVNRYRIAIDRIKADELALYDGVAIAETPEDITDAF